MGDPTSSQIPIPSLSDEGERICEAFEVALKDGRFPEIEAYLGSSDIEEREPLLLELVLLEFEYFPKLGRQACLDDYCLRFPEYRELLERRFKESSDVNATPFSIETLCSDSNPNKTIHSASHPLTPAASNVSTSLSGIWPFSELPERVVMRLCEIAEECEYESGATLISEGSACRGLIIVTRGRIDVCIHHEGRSQSVVQESAPNILGEMGLLTGAPCTATVTAQTEVQALVIPSDKFRELANEFHVLWLALSQLVAERLGRRDIDVLVGKQLDRFFVERCLGRGGMAVVYEARDVETNQRVALKMMSHRYTHNLEAQTRFEREAQLCQNLIHPHLARNFDRFTAFGTNFIIMEYCEGQTLSKLIKHAGPLPENQVRSILGQLASALSFAHARQVVHRDLKPSNVMVREDGHVKLLDFGLAKSATQAELTGHHHVLGTPSYMAPEQFEGQAIGPWTDIYALGVLAWEAITGKKLFDGKNVLQIHCQQHVWELPPAESIRHDLSADLYEFLKTATAREPELRTIDLAAIGEKWGALEF